MSFSVRVSATSANLGPGFDTLGLAVGLYLEVRAVLSDTDHFHYSGAGELSDTPDNLIHEGFRAVYRSLGLDAPKVTLTVENPIPLARGLGSSSAALVAGILLANAFLENRLARDDVFQLAASIEGHPDNVAPAIYGGFTVSALAGERYLCSSLPLPDDWQFLFGVPVFELKTSEARSVLPDSYSRADLIFNASRTALWSLAVAQNKPELLNVAAQDRVHEPYRERLIPGLRECRAALLEAGAFAVYLSGAGPTVGVVCSEDNKAACEKVLQAFVGSGDVLDLQPSAGYELS